MTQEYTDYLLSDAWKEKRKEKLIHGGKRCEVCGTKKRLQIHHLTYERIFQERMDDLMILCRKHHEAVEGLYQSSKLRKLGPVAELRAETLRQFERPVTVITPRARTEKKENFWSLMASSSRRDMLRMLFNKHEFLEVLKDQREAAKKNIKQLSRRAGNSQSRAYTNMLMTYDAFHGIGSYNKFRKEVLEVHAIVERDSNPTVACEVSEKPFNRDKRLVPEIEKVLGSIRNYTKKGEIHMALEKAKRLTDLLASELQPTLKLVSYSDGRHEWVLK